MFLASVVEISVERCRTDQLFMALLLVNWLGKYQSDGRFCPNQEFKLCIRAGGDQLATMYCDATRLPTEDFGLDVGLNTAFVNIARPISRHVAHFQNWATFDQGNLHLVIYFLYFER